MSQQGMVIDSLEFARRQETLSGRIGLKRLPRLAEFLSDAEGGVEFTVAGETQIKAEGEEHALVLAIDGSLHLVCQRCLGALEHALGIRNRLILIRPGAPWPEDAPDEDEGDAIEAVRELDLVPLIEEEILLALPIAPRHDRCEMPDRRPEAEDATPFAKLAQLKRG